MRDIQSYQGPDGSELYAEWLARLVDRQAKARVLVRVQRMAAGNFGDCKPLQAACRSCESIGGLAIACTTPLQAAAWCCCWWAATSGASGPTSPPR